MGCCITMRWGEAEKSRAKNEPDREKSEGMSGLEEYCPTVRGQETGRGPRATAGRSRGRTPSAGPEQRPPTLGPARGPARRESPDRRRRARRRWWTTKASVVEVGPGEDCFTGWVKPSRRQNLRRDRGQNLKLNRSQALQLNREQDLKLSRAQR